MSKGAATNGFTNPGYFDDLMDGEEKQQGKVNPTKELPKLIVTRPHYQQQELNRDLSYTNAKDGFCRELLDNAKQCSAGGCVRSVFPIVGWLSEYCWSRDFMSDVISGCTVAVMHIPQGMAYAILAHVPPIVGIYMAFFPVLMYFLLGTSRHNSMGTFAVVTIMVGKAVLMYSSHEGVASMPGMMGNGTLDGVTDETAVGRSPMEVATAVCFTVGIIQLIMYVCRLGVISFLLSEALVSGFTTGAAIHVLTSQIKDLLGLSLPPISGNFKIINTYIAIFSDLSNANHAAIMISLVTIVVLVINNEYLKPRAAKRSSIPIPIELIAVVSGTLLSSYFSFEEQYGVKAIGHIPTGLPAPALPDVSLFKSLLLDSFTIAMVAYAVSVSMGLIFARKQNYEIDFNQELLAMGASNVFGSFFSCMPFSASLSRSMIQFTVGGKTQIASLVSCALLAVVLLWVGPFFEPLPRCVLGGIIVVSLKGLLVQVTQVGQFWRQSAMDAIVWVVTFLTVVLVAIDIGLLVGILLSVGCIFLRGMKPYTCLLENVPNTELYLDVNHYKGTADIPGVKIFHYCGSLNFATRACFRTSLCQALELNLTEMMKQLRNGDYKKPNLCCLVIDFTALTYIDPSAVCSLKALLDDFEKLSIRVLLAGVSCPVYEAMLRCQMIDVSECEHGRLFPTVHDAVHWAKEFVSRSSSGNSTT